MSKPIASIIIVNLNGKRFLGSCFKSVKQLYGVPFEVIVVDNGSTDGSKTLIQRFLHTKHISARAIFNPTNLGFCHANNQGVRIAKGEYLLFLNNDTEVPANLLTVLLGKLKQDQSIGIIQPKILLKDEPGRLDSVGGFLTWTGFLNHLGIHERDRGQYDNELPVLSPKGACMLMSKRLFQRIGGFDENFFAYFEETDLAWRVWLTGKTAIYYPATTIAHLMGRTTRQLEFDFIQYHSYKNRVASLLINVGTGSLWRPIVHIAIVLVLATFYLVIVRFSSAAPIWRALGWNIAHIGTTIKKRWRVQRARRVDDSFLKQLSKPINFPKAIHDVFYVEHER